MRGAERRIQRRINMLATIDALAQESLSIAQLSRAIGISRPATEQVVADLAQLGWLQELEPMTAGGRPAIRWTLAPDALLVLSVDIGAHHVTVNLADHRGEILGSGTRELSEDLYADARVDAACEFARDVVKSSPYELNQIRLACVGSPGAVSSGRVNYFGGNGMPGWQGTDLATEVGGRLGCPVVVAGDCSLGALGEAWRGGAAGHKDVVYILCGMRTGAAAIVGGKVHAGDRGAAGLIGELDVLRWHDIENEKFINDGYGLDETDTPSSNALTRRAVFEQATAGDKKALAAVNEFSTALALGTAAMILAFAPTNVVIGGEFSKWSDLFLADLEAKLEKYCPLMPAVSASVLKAQAVSIGGVKYALNYVMDKLREDVRETDIFPSMLHFKCTDA